MIQKYGSPINKIHNPYKIEPLQFDVYRDSRMGWEYRIQKEKAGFAEELLYEINKKLNKSPIYLHRSQ